MRRIEGFPLWIGTARDARDIKGVSQFMGIKPVEALATLRAGGPCDVSPGLWRELAPAWYPVTNDS
jgi:hypothetical protein